MVVPDTLLTHRSGACVDASLATSFYVKYDVKDVLGSGASSTVRRCVDKQSQREYAVKILDLNSGVDDPDVIRSETSREIKILRLVNGHPNVIRLHDVFEGDAFIFLVFEVCTGGELFDYLSKQVSLSEKRTRVLMRQLLSAVAFVHEKQIVHRDHKPENILLDDELNIKLTDFGLAVLDGNEEELHMIRGTPGYLAPEVLRNGYYDEEPAYGQPVDMWACGVIMYTLLAGCPPFWNRKEHLMLRQIMEGRYSFPSPEWDDISEVSKDLISKMLVMEPSRRITCIDALNHDFFLQQTMVLPRAARKKHRFRTAALGVTFIHILKGLRYRSAYVSLSHLSTDPYANRKLRKLIDTLAYDVYSQWVKKGEEQNRAAMFETAPRRDQIDPSSVNEGDGDEEMDEALMALYDVTGGGPEAYEIDEESRGPIKLPDNYM